MSGFDQNNSDDFDQYLVGCDDDEGDVTDLGSIFSSPSVSLMDSSLWAETQRLKKEVQILRSKLQTTEDEKSRLLSHIQQLYAQYEDQQVEQQPQQQQAHNHFQQENKLSEDLIIKLKEKVRNLLHESLGQDLWMFSISGQRKENKSLAVSKDLINHITIKCQQAFPEVSGPQVKNEIRISLQNSYQTYLQRQKKISRLQYEQEYKRKHGFLH